ncbi:MFS transporter [Eubacterium limosum]|uniref:MFS transporter n=1 Tax=Eubacterium limosum TaxID=1736 RepID=UPI0022E4C4C4|nr:MFS transporter [Eubacterium limosum]
MTKLKRNFLVGLISIMVGLIYFIPYIRFSFYDQFVAAFHLTNFEFGNLGSIYGLVSLFCYPIGGVLADKFSSRAMLAASFFASMALTFWEASFPDYISLIIISALFAVFNAGTMWAAYIKLLRSLGNENEQGKIFGTSEALRGIISAIVGFVFLGLLSLFTSQISGMRMILLSFGVIYGLFGVLSIIFLPKTEKRQEESSTDYEDSIQQSGILYKITTVLKLPGTWLLSIFMFSCYCVIMSGVNYLGTYATQILGISEELSAGLAIFRNYIVVVLAGILGGILADKAKSKLLFIIYLLGGIIICSGLSPFLTSVVLLSITISMILAFLYYCVKSIYFSVMGEGGIPLELTGIATGIISFIAFIPDAFMTSLMGSWIDADPVSGFNKIFIWMVVWSIIAAVFAFIIYRRCRKST